MKTWGPGGKSDEPSDELEMEQAGWLASLGDVFSPPVDLLAREIH